MKQVVVILGPGRSGTSLAANLLFAAGIARSPSLKPPDEHNPHGYGEDVEIVKLHNGLLRARRWPEFLPMPDTVLDPEMLVRTTPTLCALIERRLALAGDAIWGFKDPRTCYFLPLWQSAFKTMGIEPLYVYCFRSPQGFVSSYQRAYPTNENAPVAALLYFWRCYYILKHTELRGYFVQSEVWQSDFRGQVEGLSKFCHIEPSNTDLDRLHSLYLPRLDNDRTEGHATPIPYLVENFYREFGVHRGLLTDKEPLRHALDAIDRLQGSSDPFISAAASMLQKARRNAAATTAIKSELSELHSANARLLQQIDHERGSQAMAASEQRRVLETRNEELRALNVRLSKSLRELQGSTELKVGRIMVDGINRGGRALLKSIAKSYKEVKRFRPSSENGGKSDPAEQDHPE